MEVSDNSNNDNELISEGSANIITSSHVFYNKVQQFNRDFSVLAINTYLKNDLCDNKKLNGNTIKILDALSATGLRSIRYALELEFADNNKPIKIIANDISKYAIELINKNILKNNVSNLVEACNSDAALLMYMNRKVRDRFSIIDLDPYGSASPFLDSAVQCVSDGGLLMVTCTDMAVLCGNHSETCHAKYGSVSLKSKCCHELALRIILRSIESHANRYGRYIVPLISLSVDFYVRIAVQIFSSPSEVRKSANKLAYIYQCVGCESFELQRLSVPKTSSKQNVDFKPAIGPIVNKVCDHCGGNYQIGGPIWAQNIYSPHFVNLMKSELNNCNNNYEQKFSTYKRLNGMLQVVSEELLDSSLYYCLDRLCRVVRCTMPSMKLFRSAILNSGYQVSYSHANKVSIKTNAPNHFLWDILRQLKKNQTNTDSISVCKNTAGNNILSKSMNSEISFDIHPNAEPPSKGMQLLRYQVNPDANWGPKSRPFRLEDKRAKNQGKRNRNSDQQSCAVKSIKKS